MKSIGFLWSLQRRQQSDNLMANQCHPLKRWFQSKQDAKCTSNNIVTRTWVLCTKFMNTQSINYVPKYIPHRKAIFSIKRICLFTSTDQCKLSVLLSHSPLEGKHLAIIVWVVVHLPLTTSASLSISRNALQSCLVESAIWLHEIQVCFDICGCLSYVI